VTTTLEMVVELGHTSDSERDWAIRQLAVWEDVLNAGMSIETSPDEMAMVRHALQYPRADIKAVDQDAAADAITMMSDGPQPEQGSDIETVPCASCGFPVPYKYFDVCPKCNASIKEN
jgi:hypothetical protein